LGDYWRAINSKFRLAEYFLPGFHPSVTGSALLFAKVRGEWAEAKGDKYDIIGALLFGAMLFFLMYGFSLLPSKDGTVLIAIGIVALAGIHCMGIEG